MNKYSIDLQDTYVLGISLVVEVLKHKPKEIKEVYLSSNVIHNQEYDSLISLCNKNNIKYTEDDKVINALSSKENCYGIAIINKYKTKLSSNKHLILKDFNDEGELGTIIRSLASFDFRDLVLINSNIDIYDPKVIRSSMGGYFLVNIAKYDTLDDYLHDFNNKVISISLDGKNELKDLKFKDNYSILIDKHIKGDYYIDHQKGSDLNYSSMCSIVLDKLFNQI